MDLPAIEALVRQGSREAIPGFQAGDAFLAGGTWLFSEPQPALRRLIDLASLGWPPIAVSSDTVTLAATCTLAQLEAQVWPVEWAGGFLVGECCRALLGSFKIWQTATVGGNLCLALPAAPMAALAVALDGCCAVWMPDGAVREVPARDFILGERRTVLAQGEVLRAVRLPVAAFRRRAAFRQISLTALGRSAALLIGTQEADGIALTITAATPHPVRLDFAGLPSSAALEAAIEAGVAAWHDDVHGAPDWRRHVTHLAAQQILAELSR